MQKIPDLETQLKDGGVDVKGTYPSFMCRCWSESHEDKTPSMSVNFIHDLFYCHGCGLTGNYVDLWHSKVLQND